MTNTSQEIQKLLSKAEGSIDKTAQLQQALARLEATLSRKETQKVTEMSLKRKETYVKKFQTLNSYLRILKTTYK